MDFEQFQKQKAQLLAERPDLVDYSDTRFAQIAQQSCPLPPLHRPDKAHRCHLAEWWLDQMGWPRHLKPQALVSQGVRHSLQVLMQHWASRHSRLALPSDVYPVYQQQATHAGVPWQGFATATGWPTHWPDVEVVLLTLPHKPWGQTLDGVALQALLDWLAERPVRRVVIDAVYQVDAQWPLAIQALWHSGQAMILHSLSKAWAMPWVMGVCLVPAVDVAWWTPIFRQQSPSRAQLCQAQALLTQATAYPATLWQQVNHAKQQLQDRLHHHQIPILPVLPQASYFVVTPIAWSSLCQQGILGVPAQVFGATPDWTVLTACAYLKKSL